MTEPNPAVLMFVAHRAAERRAMDAVLAAGGEISWAQARLIQRLDPQGTRLTDLAERAGVTKQTAGALVDQLERDGSVVRRPDPSDGRARLVVLSARGKKFRDIAQREVAKVHAEWREHLGAKTYDQLEAALTKLREITDPYR